MLQQQDFYKRFRRRFLKVKEICHKEKGRILFYVDEKKTCISWRKHTQEHTF